MTQTSRPLIIGIGNPLMADDGAGPYVVSLLGQMQGLPPADLLTLVTPGFGLLTHFAGRHTVIIADAASFAAAPGTVMRVTRDQVKTKHSMGFSLHDVDPLAVYDQAHALGLAPAQCAIYAIRFETITPRQGLSAPVEAGARKAAELIAQELSRYA